MSLRATCDQHSRNLPAPSARSPGRCPASASEAPVHTAVTLGTRSPSSPAPCPAPLSPAPPSAPRDPHRAKHPLPGPCLRLRLGGTPDMASNSGSNGGAQGMIRLRWVSREGFLGEGSSQLSFGGEECGLASPKKPLWAVQSQLAQTRQRGAERRVHTDRGALAGLRGPPRSGPSPSPRRRHL